jgi:hypothetical protein
MAYFNHAFNKQFLATGTTLASEPIVELDGTAGTASTTGALLVTAGKPTVVLNQLSQAQKADGHHLSSGYVGIFNPKTHVSMVAGDLTECCPIYIAGSAIYKNDKIGPFHGGYTETNKSKLINPKYVSRLYTQAACDATPDVLHLGNTQFTGGLVTDIEIATAGSDLTDGTFTITLAQAGNAFEAGATASVVVAGNIVTSVTLLTAGTKYLNGTVTPLAALAGGGAVVQPTFTIEVGPSADCAKEFLCDQTYSLRVDIKGSPVLRFLNRNTYLTVDAYTGCCPEGTVSPVAVDSTLVFIEWAKQLMASPLIAPFLQLVVVAEDGTILYNPATPVTSLPGGATTWDNYVSTGHIEDGLAGMIIQGAYVDTKFGDCTFQTSDFFEKEPVQVYASLVDYEGNPCEFGALCVAKECTAKQAEGFGEQVLRDLAMSESYRQNFMHSDLRIREITQGNQILSDIDREGQYDRAYLLHTVPRFNNPSSTFDNDQYLLEFVSVAGSNTLDELVDVLGTWLAECGVCEIETFTCSEACDLVVTIPVAPHNVG